MQQVSSPLDDGKVDTMMAQSDAMTYSRDMKWLSWFGVVIAVPGASGMHHVAAVSGHQLMRAGECGRPEPHQQTAVPADPACAILPQHLPSPGIPLTILPCSQYH